MASLKENLRQSWYLVVLFVVVMVLAVYGFVRHTDHSNVAVASTPVQHNSLLMTNDVSDVAAPTSAGPDLKTREREEVTATIKEYEQRIKDDPNSEDTPALMDAMANLSMQKLLDYREAARYYELLLNDYPQWTSIQRVYPRLAKCYELMGDTKSQQWVFRRMMEKFPQDSQEYLYAKTELGM